MNTEKIAALLEKYRDGTMTDQERALLETWYLRQAGQSSYEMSPEQLDSSMAFLKKNLPLAPARQRRLWSRMAAAAAVIIVLATGGYFLLKKTPPGENKAALAQDAAPGGNKAVLTLSDGRRITLSDAASGRIATEENVTVSKTAEGELKYSNTRDTPGALVYNSVSTPRGGQYSLVLADGTKVMLNAASSLKYPASFTGTERRVELTGEAFFEIAKNTARPFRVVSRAQTVTVLGTRFNINAYTDEPLVKTTLVDGSVQVQGNRNGAPLLLKPGQQAVMAGDAAPEAATAVNMEQALAWKNGYFRFYNEDLHAVTRQLARWYNVDFVFDGPVSAEEYTGKISRFKNLGQVLTMLESTRTVHFSITGNKVRVTK